MVGGFGRVVFAFSGKQVRAAACCQSGALRG